MNRLGKDVSETNTKKYWAFISYSSRDAKWGKWFHKRLENYTIPKEFQGVELSDGARLGRHIRPVFRDRDELASSSQLGEVISEALEQSRILVVLCSPNSAKSIWVNKEIEEFQAMHGDGNVLALILNGEPNASSSSDFDDSLECFPPALRLPFEPMAGDLRPDADGRERGFLKILAGIADVGFDDLYRRHERAKKRRRFVFGSAAAILIAVLIVLTLFAFSQKSIAEAQTVIAKDKTKLAQDKTILANKERERADEEAERARKSETDAKFQLAVARWDANRVAEAKRLLHGIPREYRNVEWYLSNLQFLGSDVTCYGHERAVECVAFSQDSQRIASGDITGTIKIWDAVTGEELQSFNGHSSSVQSISFSPDSQRVATGSLDKSIKIWDVTSGREQKTLGGHRKGCLLYTSPSPRDLSTSRMPSSA